MFNPRLSHTKDLKMVLDSSLVNRQHYKERTKGKVGRSRGKSRTPPLHLGIVAIDYGRQIYLHSIFALRNDI